MRTRPSIAALATEQYGIVAHKQLRDLGLTESAISRRIADATLHKLHQGVYAVGHAAVSKRGTLMAALLACGPGAMLSHSAAAWMWGLLAQLPSPIDVTVTGHDRRHAGIRVHRSRTIRARDTREREQLRLTGVPRTLLDLVATGSRRRADGLVDRAERLGLLDVAAVDDLLARSRGARGTARLRTAMDLYRDVAMTRSMLESRFLDLVLRAGLPRPSMNYYVAGMEVDAYWEQEQFVVELDGYETHGSRRSFERDRVRQETLALAGIASIRITARRLDREPKRIVSNLRALLAGRRPR
jgi:very-short-patch-repair endonuclease